MSTANITSNTTRKDEELALWEAMGEHKATYKYMTEEQQQQTMQDMIRRYGGVQKAIEAYQEMRRVINDPNTPYFPDISPREGVICKSIEFDNIKIFYHPMREYWNFYIARPGAQPSECIDWRAAGIEVVARGPDGKWGETWVLMAPSDSRVRIEYPFGEDRRTHEIIFPSSIESPFPTHYLEEM